MRRVFQALAFTGLVLSTRAAVADALRTAAAARPQVVKITAAFDGEQPTRKHGFGFVVGERGGFLYVATANHVVRTDDDDSAAATINVQFFSDQGVTYPATVLETHRRPPTDLAVIKVATPVSAPTSTLCDDGPALRRGTPAVYVGRDGDWYVPTTAGVVNSGAPDESFHSEVDFSHAVAVKEGTSGAPLISQRGLLGMVIQDSNSNVATVLAIEAIARAFQGWNHPWTVGACDASRPAEKRRFEFGVSFGYGLPFGKADNGDDGDLAHFTRAGLPIALDGEFYLTPDLAFGAFFQYARLLDNEGECPDCNGSAFVGGLTGRYRVALGPRLKGWADLGVGYDQMSSAEITWRGFQYLRVETGADISVTPRMAVGPFVSFSRSHYSKQGADGLGVPAGDPMWLIFGLRTAVFVP